MMQEWLDAYRQLEAKHQDPRTVGWFLVGSPVDGALICVVYVILVTIIGPKWMKNREPMNIRGIMVIYNFLMVLLSVYMVYMFLMGGWATSYTFGCHLLDTSRSPEAMTMVMACYLFYLSKFIELLDTVFFVLRKKFELITFLHVFHHAIMPASWWVGVKFSPGGMGTFHALLNSFVHVCMYTYYGIAAMGPQYQKYIWWKKYMTKIQIIQFITVMVHTSQQFITDCTYPKLFAYWIFTYAVIFLVLFANFYIQAYRRRRRQSLSQKNVATNTTISSRPSSSQNGHSSQKPHNGLRPNGFTNGNNNYTSNRLKED